jgi:hypothetical protein
LEGYAPFSFYRECTPPKKGGKMAQEFAFAAPRPEEMTEVAIGLGSAGVTGLAEGVVVKFAPGLGALEPVFTWGTLLGVPLIGVAGALFTRGMINGVFKGIAAGGAAILGYSLPALVAPFMPSGARRLGGSGVKQLPPGSPLQAPQMAQAQARVGLEF